MTGLTLDVTDFGAVPGRHADAAPTVWAALRAAQASGGPVTLRFPPGDYHLWPSGAQRRELYVSNTVGDDPRFRVKTIALLVEATDDLVLSGPGARLIVHGVQTTFAVIDSRRIRIEGLEFDFAVPTVVDATVVDAGVAAGHAFRVIRVPAATPFSIEGRSVRWHGEILDSGPAWEGRDALEYTQIHDPSRETTRRGPNPLFDRVRSIRAVGDRDIQITYDHDAEPVDTGLVYQMRLTTRDHPGALVFDSSGVTVSGVRFRFLHGPGVVVQTSRDVAIEDCAFQAPPGTGRHTAGFADFVQFSGCSGRVVVRGCLFDGPHDDPVNVHGTYLRVVSQPDPHTLVLVYAHPETAGFPQFAAGDRVEIVDRTSLRVIASTVVDRARQPSGRDGDHPLRTIVLTVRTAVPDGLAARAAVENVTRTPSVHIAGNVFRNMPTRGVLVTTRRPILIEENRFERPAMAAVYVSCDAGDWWESGPVRSLTIRRNAFVEPGAAAVLVDPRVDGGGREHPVHHGIFVEANCFMLDGVAALDATRTRGIRFRNNTIERPGADFDAGDVVLSRCSDVSVDAGVVVRRS
ncbi:right-handed parallel beta-helix repeat-containing protein [Micromonospora sp. NPDC049559]|uniref:right-handed parallel beta-helix repeat-containing protein n=1 Tax=Micromonospora sp. NPDC049559 TaxID=3155923 RepID=UPI0034423FC3